MSGAVVHVAASEDDPIEWFARTCTRGQARGVAASDFGEARWRISVKGEYMRPVVKADCDAAVHVDEDEDAEHCTCSRIGEGWMLWCDAVHQDAVAVWRAEVASRQPLWLTRTLRRLHPETRHRRRPAPLWGARPQRRANRLDQLLLGRGVLLILGDRQVRIGEVEWHPCRACGGPRPHRADRTGWLHCDAQDHHWRHARPIEMSSHA